jgi:hypothetical protein
MKAANFNSMARVSFKNCLISGVHLTGVASIKCADTVPRASNSYTLNSLFSVAAAKCFRRGLSYVQLVNFSAFLDVLKSSDRIIGRKAFILQSPQVSSPKLALIVAHA